MKTLTKREAIRECKRLWKEIEKSGLTKLAFLNSQAGERWEGRRYDLDCPLCEYETQHRGKFDCERCPLLTQYGKGCYSLGFGGLGGYSSPEWFKVIRGLRG